MTPVVKTAKSPIKPEEVEALVKQFDSLLVPAPLTSKNCVGAHVEIGAWTGKEYEDEGDHHILLDPLGNAWIRLGPHNRLPERKGE